MSMNLIIIVIRYIALAMLYAGVGMNISSFNTPLLLVMLSTIIINQLRFFTFKKNNLFVIATIILEAILVSYITSLYSGSLIFGFIGIILDSIFLLEENVGYKVIGLIALNLVILGRYFDLFSFLTTIFVLIMISLLAFYIRYENKQKINAQTLYDKLKTSEEMLKKANNDLELYASSIEELTLLKERNRISREIHDSVGHALSTTLIQLGAMEQISLKENSKVAPLASNLREFVKASYEDVRKAVKELKPIEYSTYEDLIRVEELVKNFIKLTGIDVRLTISKNKWKLNSYQSLAIYRIIQEALSNSSRHGKAKTINIIINFNESNVIITIQDNGIGCQNIYNGVGLNSISERVKELKGNFSYNTAPTQGFLLKVTLPKESGGEIFE